MLLSWITMKMSAGPQREPAIVLDHNGHKLALKQLKWSASELDLNEHEFWITMKARNHTKWTVAKLDHNGNECWIIMKACHGAGSQWPQTGIEPAQLECC